MFTGIVEEVGLVAEKTESPEGARFKIKASRVLEDACLGESISVSGACLTVIEFDKDSFSVEATIETLRCTKLGMLEAGSRVNLEKAMKADSRLGGHLVSGHVDALGEVIDIKEEGFSKIIRFSVPGIWAPYFVKKGSVTVDGVSLTVVDIGHCLEEDNPAKLKENLNPGKGREEQSINADPACTPDDRSTFWFSVALIPHTLEVTTTGDLAVGAPVNVETDIIARYVVRLLGEAYLPKLNIERDSILLAGDKG